MSPAGVPPFTDEQLRHRYGAAIGALPGDARGALCWLRRGHLATSPLLPLAVRRTLLRLGGVKLGAMVWGLERCCFQSPLVSIGTGSALAPGCYFEGTGRIDIGRDCIFGPGVMVLTSVHAIGPDGGIARFSQPQGVTIRDGSWMGARAMVMPGATIGEGAVVAAGALVTKNCDAGGPYGGVPARRLR